MPQPTPEVLEARIEPLLCRPALAFVLFVMLVPRLVAQASSWDVEGRAFVFPSAVLRDRIAVQGFSSVASHLEQDLVLAFTGDRWTLRLDELELLAGTYVRPGPRRVELELDAQGEHDVLARHALLAGAWSADEQLGEVVSELAPWRTRLRLRLRRQHGSDFDVVVARLFADVRTRGCVRPDGLAGPRTARVASVARGTSAGIPEILLDGSPPPSAPVASFVLGATSGQAPLTIGLLSTASGLVSERHWSFGDGSESEGLSVLHTFGPGEHLVTHTVEGPGGSHSSSQTVWVAHPPLPLQILYLGWSGGQTPSPDDDEPVLVPMPGPQTVGSVVFGGGDVLTFGIDLPLPTNGAGQVTLDLSLGTSPLFGALTVHELEISLHWLRADGDEAIVLGPITRVASGPSKITFHGMTPVPLLASAGERLELVLRDLSTPEDTGGASAELYLGVSRVAVAGPP